MRRRALVDATVEVPAETHAINVGCAGKRGNDCFCRNEAPSPQRYELADGHAVPRDDEGLTLVELTHDLAALVAQLALRDLSAHRGDCSTRATRSVEGAPRRRRGASRA